MLARTTRFGRPDFAVLQSIADAVSSFHPLQRFMTTQLVAAEDVSDDEKSLDWATLCLQAGFLTLGARALLFHEFHTHAFVRLRVPNEAVRRAYREELLSSAYCGSSAAVMEAMGTVQEIIDRRDDLGYGRVTSDELLFALRRVTSTITDAMRGVDGGSRCSPTGLILATLMSLRGSSVLSVDECERDLDLSATDVYIDSDGVDSLRPSRPLSDLIPSQGVPVLSFCGRSAGTGLLTHPGHASCGLFLVASPGLVFGLCEASAEWRELQ